jgi:hypothetical protein
MAGGTAKMTDLTRFPEAVREKLADLDRRIEGAQSEERDHQRELSRLQIDLAQNLILRAAIVETAECVLQVCAPKLEDQVSADHVLNFIIRAGDMGVNDAQLDMIGCTDSILAILRHNETAAQGDDGRWRAVVETTEMEDEA